MSFGDLTLDWRTRGRRWRQLQTIKLLERERGRVQTKPKKQKKKKDLKLKMNAQAEFQNCFRSLIFKGQVNKIANKTRFQP